MATVHKTQRASALADLLSSPSMPVLLTLSAVAIGIAALLPLIQSSDATSINGSVQRLEQEKADWQARLHELELEVAGMGSLDRIEREARERFHMTTPKDVHYLTVEQPAPEPRRLPSRFLPPATQERDSGSSVWDKLFGWLSPP